MESLFVLVGMAKKLLFALLLSSKLGKAAGPVQLEGG